MNREMDCQGLEDALRLLDGRLMRAGAVPVNLVVCGGAALIATGLLQRTTSDVDIVAFLDAHQTLMAPVPLPDALTRAAFEVAEVVNLPPDWLNNAPSRDQGGLFQMGLPAGFQDRLHPRIYGDHLTIWFIDRLDQIHFKLYAAVDRGGYHLDDLAALKPSRNELLEAAHWAMTHDVSEAFRKMLKSTLQTLGYDDAAEAL